MANEQQELNQPEDMTPKSADALAVDTSNDPTPPSDDVTSPVGASVPDTASTTAQTPATEPAGDDTPADSANVVDTTPEIPADVVATEQHAEPPTPLVTTSEPPAADASPADATTSVAATDGVPETAAPTSPETVSEAGSDPQSTTPAAPTDDRPSADDASLEPAIAEEITAQYADADDDTTAEPTADFGQLGKTELVALLDKLATDLKSEGVTPGDFKRADDTLKQAKARFDQLRQGERQTALERYQAETGSDEGFLFKNDDDTLRFDALYKQIKSQKNGYFQSLDKAKDTNFAQKTELLRQLRELVESDESNAGDAKTSWNEFKRIQDEWKAAGNINSPHNATLWATYHALVDRYYSNRNIYFELKELDRKKNAGLKTEVIEKVEALGKDLDDKPVTRQLIDEANALFEEYKHIGPAPKAEQEALWQRMKAALDALYEKRRGQSEEQRKESAQLYEEKSKLYEELVPFTSFGSNSINDWNDKTKAVMAIQERWNALRGAMPREEGKELSKKFWAALKTFFHNKGEFFKQLEAKREENLRQKTELCEQVEAILAAGDESQGATQRVIELQRQWKNVGQVPEKQKNSIFERFKTACDTFFNQKRSRNQETEREFETNLAQKTALIERIEAAAAEDPDLSQLNAFKREWNSIGFVPKKDMQATQKRYINAINTLVGAMGKLSARDKERALRENEAELHRGGRSGGGDAPRGGFRRDRDGGDSGRGGELRRRISALENDIATYNNNIEFFARSKNADKLRADIEQKIADAQRQLDELRQQLREAQQA